MYIRNDVYDFVQLRSNNLKFENMRQKVNSKNYKALKGCKNIYTSRMGKYRLIILIENSSVYIINIDNRDHIYDSINYNSEKNKIKDANYVNKKYIKNI